MAFGWERHVPFWPWTIFPYWSINVLYALSPFLGRTPHRIDRHGARLLTATLIACACFVLWPLRFSFGQPAVTGAPALLFDALRSFDQPYNQAPSLHIALAVILWDWYRRLPASGWGRLVVHVWALAICASVLTTYQHHFIDIPTGALLGTLCVWLWPLERVVALPCVWRLARDRRRLVLAACYALCAALLLGAALYAGGMALWLCWPAASLGLVALNYLGFGARGFRMNAQGRMDWSARWLFAPYRLGAAINAWLWTRKLPASVEVRPGLRLGRRPSMAEWQAAGQPRLVSLCAELQLPPVANARCIPLLDLVAPSPAQLRRAAAVIEGQRLGGGNRPIWVCCALGFSRSAAAVIGWLGRHGPMAGDLARAESAVREARPQIALTPAWRAALADITTASQGPRHER
jgi:hypothetical protein